MQLQGKIALISGASRNIGRTIALKFAREGADLILVARQNIDELKQVAKECGDLGVKALAVQADVSKHDEVNRMVQQGLDRFGRVDTLVSVAAIRPHKPFWEITYEEWHQVFDINLHATFYLAKALVPGMMKQKSGSIVALGALSSITSQPLRAHVVASKTGLYGLVKALALELGPYGVRANLIALGAIDVARANPDWYPEKGGKPRTVSPGTPLGRIGTAEEVANIALFLASDQSSYVTGDRIICAGGKYM